MIKAAVLGLLSLLLVVPTASAQALFHGDDLIVYDSTGKTVGALANPAIPEIVFRTGAGRTIFVYASASSLTGNADLYFLEPECSGTPVLTRAGSGRQPSSFIGGPRQTAYVSAGEFTRQRVRSVLAPDGQCIASSWTTDVARAVRAGVDFADYFAPPFALRAAAGAPVPAGAVAQPLEATDGFVVYDGNGKKIGATRGDGVYAPAAAVVGLVTGSGMTLLLEVFDSELAGAAYYESTDCTGPPFMIVDAQSLVPSSTLVGPRRAIHTPAGEATRRTVSSVDHGFGDCQILRDRFTIGRPMTVAPAEPVGIELLDYFTPPYTVRAGRATRALPTVR